MRPVKASLRRWYLDKADGKKGSSEVSDWEFPPDEEITDTKVLSEEDVGCTCKKLKEGGGGGRHVWEAERGGSRLIPRLAL